MNEYEPSMLCSTSDIAVRVREEREKSQEPGTPTGPTLVVLEANALGASSLLLQVYQQGARWKWGRQDLNWLSYEMPAPKDED